MFKITTGIWRVTDTATHTRALPFRDLANRPYDFTGSTFRLNLKTDPEAADIVVTLSTENGGILSTDLVNSTITLKLVAGTLPPGEYWGDLTRIAGGVPTRLIRINLSVAKGI